jgi:hypothetical protein
MQHGPRTEPSPESQVSDLLPRELITQPEKGFTAARKPIMAQPASPAQALSPSQVTVLSGRLGWDFRRATEIERCLASLLPQLLHTQALCQPRRLPHVLG